MERVTLCTTVRCNFSVKKVFSLAIHLRYSSAPLVERTHKVRDTHRTSSVENLTENDNGTVLYTSGYF